MSKQIITSAAMIAGATLVGSLSVANLAQAGDNPFVTEQLESGYLQLAEGSCGEGKCGSKDDSEGKCGSKDGGEGKCGEGKCGSS
ncbi:MAG: low-complexity protein [Lamprobacter sp.]|uniref:HvfA family oxazolone/thioamide-modified RiPP metallophore n=1 Tax=Lamprobacter sp. TaxID=3100796 RepID=UPI002B25D666|nr:low-complexity protein [Lamprobacter sp.]MEA3642409.1 low-complexity protein [Lamprobacter sp.]